MSVREQKLVAHRGANNEVPGNLDIKYPENTLWSLTEALNQEVTFIELDVIKLKDDKFIVFHDDTLERLGQYNREMVTTLTTQHFNAIRKKKLTQLTYEEVSQVDVGCYADYLDTKFKATPIPLLENYLEKVAGTSARLVIELKSDRPEIIASLESLITQCKKSYLLENQQLMFISFDLPLISASKRALPEHQHLFLTTYSPSWRWGLYHRIKNFRDLKKMIAVVQRHHLDGLNVECSQLIDATFVARIHEKDLLCAVWNYPATHDNFSTLQYLLEIGVDMVNTNQPAYMRRQLLQSS